MMTTARTELLYPRSPQAKSRRETSRRGKFCDLEGVRVVRLNPLWKQIIKFLENQVKC